MTSVDLSDRDVATLAALAEVLVPGTATMPAPSAIATYEGLIRTAVAACGHPAETIRRALDALGPDVDWDAAKVYASADPDGFHVASELVTAAYYMAPQALEALGYPVERRHPAGLEEFADEFESGILDPILAMAPRFRDPR